MLILSLQDLPRSQSLETVPICIVAQCVTHDNFAGCTCMMNVNLVTAQTSFFTDHKISGLPIRTNNRQFRTISDQKVDNSPTDSFSSSLT